MGYSREMTRFVFMPNRYVVNVDRITTMNWWNEIFQEKMRWSIHMNFASSGKYSHDVTFHFDSEEAMDEKIREITCS